MYYWFKDRRKPWNLKYQYLGFRRANLLKNKKVIQKGNINLDICFPPPFRINNSWTDVELIKAFFQRGETLLDRIHKYSRAIISTMRIGPHISVMCRCAACVRVCACVCRMLAESVASIGCVCFRRVLLTASHAVFTRPVARL